MNPRYPVYVISKSRWKSRLTAKALIGRDVPFKLVIEPQEYNEYAAVVDPSHIETLPFSNLGQGSIPARNWVWEHAIQRGFERHWILDDNISHFFVLRNHKLWRTTSGTTFRICEDFTDRFENVALSGMQYKMFATPRNKRLRPYTPNTRIYSCILIKNDIPYRWRGRYNEDTDLSLRALKDGWTTVLFTGLLAEKMATMTMHGGNSDELYQDDGRLRMARSLQLQHPDVAKVVRKWGRWQHSVDYRPFRNNKFILKPDAKPMKTLEEYGLTLQIERRK